MRENHSGKQIQRFRLRFTSFSSVCFDVCVLSVRGIVLICQCSATHAQHHRLKQHWESTNDFLCLLKYAISCSCSSAPLPVNNFDFDICFSCFKFICNSTSFFFPWPAHTTHNLACVRHFFKRGGQIRLVVNWKSERSTQPQITILSPLWRLQSLVWNTGYVYQHVCGLLIGISRWLQRTCCRMDGSPEVVFICRVAAYVTCDRPCAIKKNTALQHSTKIKESF